jgi:RNA polymerase sigma-70 factor (ECF subfamily)
MPQRSPESEVADYRPLAFAIAYRMLGSVAEAEDIVQDAFLRMHQARQAGVVVENPKAYLAALATRIAIDHLRSARVRRESYFGTWLPEPVVDEGEPAMDEKAERAESVSMAFMLILEALSPVERAVFLLREVFDYSYEEIAGVVQKSEDNCRQIFARARRHIDAGKRRFEPSPEKRAEIADRFFTACQKGELSGLVQLLAADATFYGDGGGNAVAFVRPVVGAERVSRLLAGLFSKFDGLGARVERVEVNGQPGAKFLDASNRVFAVWSLDSADGQVQCIRSVVNPDKLRHLGPVSELLSRPALLRTARARGD